MFHYKVTFYWIILPLNHKWCLKEDCLVLNHDGGHWLNEYTWDHGGFDTENNKCGRCLASVDGIFNAYCKRDIDFRALTWVLSNLYRSVSIKHWTMYTSFICSILSTRRISRISMIWKNGFGFKVLVIRILKLLF